MSRSKQQPAFRVGDRVRFNFGKRRISGVVVEDRGPIGVQGRRLFQVDVPLDPFDPMTLELPESEMEAIPAGETPAPLDRQAIIDYLIHGGLISILRTNLAGGKYQPRAWLSRSQLGNVTYTLVEERGMVGGAIVPVGAIYTNKVAKAKRDQVVKFVESFGLTRPEAERVISEVGTGP
ncbi:MAG: hypothetical protein JNM56_39485 [Planctomycetia bacterium]|nr:hypothetical protein [Planctomycetia bacterium]